MSNFSLSSRTVPGIGIALGCNCIYKQLRGGVFFGAPLHRTADKIDGWWGIRFLDQRGTGLSTPVSPSTLGSRGDDQVQTRYLQSFRADSIAHDAEGA